MSTESDVMWGCGVRSREAQKRVKASRVSGPSGGEKWFTYRRSQPNITADKGFLHCMMLQRPTRFSLLKKATLRLQCSVDRVQFGTFKGVEAGERVPFTGTLSAPWR